MNESLVADRLYRPSADILQAFSRHPANDLQIVCRSASTSEADLQQTTNRSARFVRDCGKRNADKIENLNESILRFVFNDFIAAERASSKINRI